MTVYVDDAFTRGDWGRWTGGGHLQADTSAELHAFATRLGLKRDWFQSRPGRPELDHYDLTRGKREQALRLGAAPETAGGATRRTLARTDARTASRQTRAEHAGDGASDSPAIERFADGLRIVTPRHTASTARSEAQRDG
jgi:hypothetical protein